MIFIPRAHTHIFNKGRGDPNGYLRSEISAKLGLKDAGIFWGCEKTVLFGFCIFYQCYKCNVLLMWDLAGMLKR